jgi:diaminopimelate decarboxylase
MVTPGDIVCVENIGDYGAAGATNVTGITPAGTVMVP